MSQFILSLAYEKSLQIINETPLWLISDSESKLINEMLADTTPVNSELKQLLTLGEYLHTPLTPTDWQVIIDIIDNPFIAPCEHE